MCTATAALTCSPWWMQAAKNGRSNWPAAPTFICSPPGTPAGVRSPGWNGIIPICPGMARGSCSPNWPAVCRASSMRPAWAAEIPFRLLNRSFPRMGAGWLLSKPAMNGITWCCWTFRTAAAASLYQGKGEHLCTPAWNQGQHTIGWSHDSSALFAIRNSRGFANLVRLGLDGTQERIDTAPYTWLWQLSVSPVANEAAFIASSPQTPTRILRWDGTRLQVVAHSESETTDPAFLPYPQAVDWPTSDGTQVHGLYYPPTHPGFESRGLPPAIFNIHGGPTSLMPTTYSLENAYYTSRGYAVVEVNYRGSSGYGRQLYGCFARALG